MAGWMPEKFIGKFQPGIVNVSIKKIVLGVDGSAPAVEATRYAMGLAKLHEAEIIAVFVRPDGEDSVIPEDQWEYLAKKSKKVRYGLAGLELARRYAEVNNLYIKLLFLSGSPVKQIVEVAEREGADLIVVGDTGLTGIKRIALGSVAAAVVEASAIPVLVVKSMS